MSNFVKVFEDGQSGHNIGLTTGIRKLDIAINGIQKKTSIGVAAAPKTGKTALVDFCYLVAPYLQMKREERLDDIEWIYWSYEIDRVSKEFKIAALFMFIDYQIYDFTYEDKKYLMSANYLMGKLIDYDENGKMKQIKISQEHSDMLKEIYVNRIVPIFGEYNRDGVQVRKGKVRFIDEADNPTGMYKYMLRYANENGHFLYERYGTYNDEGAEIENRRIVGYQENNPNKFTICITDHVRKCIIERKFTMKQNIDKWLEYSTILVNRCSFTVVNILHSNRNVSNVDRLKMHGESIFPTADDIKDTGNLAEESTILMTLFNPSDEKYNLTKHFGVVLKDNPLYRSLHITESRYTECPTHIRLNAYNNINYFTQLNIENG